MLIIKRYQSYKTMARLSRFRKCLRFPFTVGYHVLDTSRPERPIARQDGFIASLVFLVLLLALTLALSLGFRLTTNWSISIKRPTIEILSGGMQVICIFLLCYLIWWRRRQTHQRHASDSNSHANTREFSKKYLPILGITVFLIGIIAMGVLEIVAFIDCASIYRNLTLYKYKLRYGIIHSITNIIEILFTCTVAILCFMHVRGELCLTKTASMRYALILVLANVIWIWGDTQLIESFDQQAVDIGYPEYTRNLTCKSPPDQEHKCLCKSTDLYELSEKASKILYSFVVEYCLLVLECILHIFLSLKDEKHERSPEVEGDVDSDGGSDRGVGANQGGLMEDLAAAERRSLRRKSELWYMDKEPRFQSHIQIEESAMRDDTPLLEPACSSTEASIDHVDQRNTLPSTHLVYFFAGLVFGTILVVLAAIKASGDFKDKRKYDLAYFISKLVFQVIAILVTIQGFIACRGFHSNHKGYSGYEMLTVFTSFGSFVYAFFLLPAKIMQLLHTEYYEPMHVPHNKPANSVYVLFLIANIFEVYLQTLFMLHSSKIKPPSEGGPTSIPDSVYTLKKVVLYLAICNIFIWALESFIEVQYVPYMFQFERLFYGSLQWDMIAHITYPIKIFYRFNSCIYLFDIHLCM